LPGRLTSPHLFRSHPPGLDAVGAVVGNAQALRDGIRRLEADAPHVSGQPLWLVFDHRDRGVTVGLVDAHGQPWMTAMDLGLTGHVWS